MDFSSEYLKKWKYDVFLSFRGEDTRNNFTGHLYEALCQKGVYTFIDNEELNRGQGISPALEKAIEDSRISVVVLSKTFAFSTSCLNEVLKILEIKDSKGQLVLPVFYNVDPSELRHQKGSFEEGLVKHKDRLENMEKVKRWSESLCHVASLSGWHLSKGHESTFIKRIVEEILNRLNRTPLNVAKHPVGLESPVLDMESLLGTQSEKDVRVVGIHGIGGIGKTTIAKALYNHISNQFEAHTFIANVREISKQKFGLVRLQEALLSETLNCRDIKVGSVDRGINLIKSRLCSKRVLIVIDDVDSIEQLESLVGENSWLGSGSRVVITTRDEHLLIAHNIEAVYKVKELSYDHALELFSWYAFKKPCPPTNYENLSSHILNYSKGLPLALTVLGSYLFGRSITEWKSAIHKLKNTPSKQISKVLKISFDGLEENEKAMFLDIACFFKGEDKEYVKKILEACDLHPDIGIGVLVDKSLVTVDMNKLWMHDLIQEMAKEIVLSECPKDPSKRSRLWFYQDVLQVLMEQKESNSIEGIRLDVPETERVKISGKALEKMKKLRILMVDNASFSGGVPYLSEELKLIDWPKYPSSTLPPNFYPKRLVSVKMNHSRIKHLWKGVKIFRDLKFLSFSCCEYLSEIPNLSLTPHIESLNLDHCKSLMEVHESVGSLEKLVTLNLAFCSNLKTLPSGFRLKSLRSLLLTGCSNLRNFPEIVEKMASVEEVLLEGTSIKALPQSIEHLIGLKALLLDSCQMLEHVPSSIEKLQYLTCLSLTNCPKIRELPLLSRNTSLIWTDNCKSLQKFPHLYSPSSSFVGVQDFRRVCYMSFVNCHKLIHKQLQDHITNRLFQEVALFSLHLPL
ncbi:hypothetical protein QN277_000265 [Acacia crassicarpa]|uniref:TIR domain-containing protein n=1 Tax=Acacia crassicarpa TaxID=499986 RepID=A0AAE1N625_9FABA|nr:hypothetical protein QN277_000265 [Acacia crassicarpa]